MLANYLHFAAFSRLYHEVFQVSFHNEPQPKQEDPMRKFMTLILASLIVGSAAPVLAAEPETPETQLPKVLTDLGITAKDLQDVDKAVVDETTKGEATIMQHYRRYCRRGYRYEAYRVRIGRFVVVRYRCVRYYHGYDVKEPAAQPPVEQHMVE
jgi:hypothetical protein